MKNKTTWNKTIEELLETPYWIIDILPKRVPKDSLGQYFAVERYMMEEPRRTEIKNRHASLVLKLNCYRSVSIDDGTSADPAPETLARLMCEQYINIRIGEAMIASDPDDTYLTLYDPDEELLEMTKAIAAAEGMFVWR